MPPRLCGGIGNTAVTSPKQAGPPTGPADRGFVWASLEPSGLELVGRCPLLDARRVEDRIVGDVVRPVPVPITEEPEDGREVWRLLIVGQLQVAERGPVSPLGDTHVLERVVERKHGRSGRGQTVANMSRPEVWAEYDRWNAVIANVVFPELDHVAPAYLDLEDEMLEEIASAMGVQAEDVEGSLANAVAATLDQSTPRLIFKQHTSRLWQWSKGDSTAPPPILALLAVFSLAAEHMTKGEGISGANYFGRLHELLGIPQNDVWINGAYRKVAERYWGTLNGWLTDLGGRRGVPTAYAVTHRYVGLPVSQALVRRGDRERLVSFFQRFGFAPGSEVPPSELETVLGIWMKQSPCPATKNLERLWVNGAARSRIAQAAAVALSAWDGRVARDREDGGARDHGRIALSLEMGGFPKKRFKISVLVYAAQPERAREAVILSRGTEAHVTLAPAIPGALSLGQSAEIDSANLLEGTLRLRDTLTGVEIVRHPKRMLVFRQDQLSMRWIETEQVMLGDDVTLVAHDELQQRLRVVLEAIARPGWELIKDGFPGLPDGWFVVRGVEIFGHPGDLIPAGMNDLGALIPLTSTQLKIAGGFALPGASRGKWHSWAPPEIRAISDVPGGFTVRLIDLNSHATDEGAFENEAAECLLEEWHDNGEGVRVADLADCELEDGDYRVELVPMGETDALTTTQVRLRSADTPDAIQWQVCQVVQQHLSDPLSVLGAGSSLSGPVVQGAVVTDPSESKLVEAQLPSSPWWDGSRPLGYVPLAAGARVTLPDPASCVYTGRHVEVIGTVMVDHKTGKPLQSSTIGQCAGCGLVRRYSTSYFRNKRKKEKKEKKAEAQPVRRRDVSEMPRVRVGEVRAWDLVVDGVMHTGGGRWSMLERLAMHIEPTGLFVDQFARAMESLGLLEIRRDSLTLQPIEWEVAPTALAGTRNGFYLVGHWPKDLTDLMTKDQIKAGVEFLRQEQSDGPGSRSFRGDAATVTAVARAVDIGVAVVDRSWRDLAVSLPLLSEVVAALPRRGAGVAGKIRWFDLRHARWVDAADLRAPGAYRISKWATLDVLRTDADVEADLMATSTVQLSKHAAALILKEQPLLAYNKATEGLKVPLGADLPGLYGRSAVLASGLLPVVAGGQLIYQNVPAELAGHLAHLLAN